MTIPIWAKRNEAEDVVYAPFGTTGTYSPLSLY